MYMLTLIDIVQSMNLDLIHELQTLMSRCTLVICTGMARKNVKSHMTQISVIIFLNCLNFCPSDIFISLNSISIHTQAGKVRINDFWTQSQWVSPPPHISYSVTWQTYQLLQPKSCLLSVPTGYQTLLLGFLLHLSIFHMLPRLILPRLISDHITPCLKLFSVLPLLFLVKWNHLL